MVILETPIAVSDLQEMARQLFGDMVKAVVDIDREIIALDAELHSDLEAALLGHGSTQQNLWGINLYPELGGEDFLEYDSMINVRPSLGNLTRGVEDGDVRTKIARVVAEWITR